jgi:transcriptional regulator with XRE-family HTH domain
VAVTFINVKNHQTTTRWGDEVRRIRKEQGLSQRGLAKMAQINRSSLRRFEANSDNGTLSLLERIANVLGYEIDLMFRGFVSGRLNSEPKRATPVAHSPAVQS